MANQRVKVKGGSSKKKAGGQRQPQRFAFGERTIPAPSVVTTVATPANKPNKNFSVPVPELGADPVGVKVEGWRVSVSSTDDVVRFNLGSTFGKSVTVFIPVDDRDDEREIELIGQPDSVYAVMFVTQTYYTNTTAVH